MQKIANMISEIKSLSVICLIMLGMLLIVSCSDEILVPEFTTSFETVENDSTNRSFTFSFDGEIDLMALYTGDPGHEFRFSSLMLNSQDFIEQLGQEGVVVGQCTYQYDNPVYEIGGAVIDTFRVIQMPVNGVDYLWAEIYSKYSDSYYIKRFKSNYLDSVGSLIPETWHIVSSNQSQLEAYDEGFSVDAKYKTYTYYYPVAGSYEATMVATNVGQKQFEGDGYQTERYHFLDEYGISRTAQSFELTAGLEWNLEIYESETSMDAIAVLVPESIKNLAMGLEESDFELIDGQGNAVSITQVTPTFDLPDFLGIEDHYLIKADYLSGVEYGIRPVNAFYGGFVYTTPNP